MNTDGTATFDTIIGKHVLTEVVEGELSVRHCGEYEDVNFLAFRLDGKYYLGIEDPSDGYRSMLDELLVFDSWESLQSKAPNIIHNSFAPVEVIGIRYPGRDSSRSEIYGLIDIKNGNLILSCGTDYSDGYYPQCVMEWNPDKMAVNA